MPFDNGCEDTGYVAVRLDFVELAGLDERREHGPVVPLLFYHKHTSP